MKLFTEGDRELVRSLKYDPESEPSFELIKSCLVWPDEIPSQITSPGRSLLDELLATRGFIHRQTPLEEWGVTGDASCYQELWLQAIAEIPEWPGFRRLGLNKKDRGYYERCLDEAATADDW